MIILFEENETLFRNLGLGLLGDARSCIVKEGLNDTFEVELTYPITGSNFSKLLLNRIIFCKPNPYSEAQPFRICSISKPINGMVTVQAVHISYDMNGIPVAPINGATPKTTLDQIQNKAISTHNFKFYTDLVGNKTFKTTNYYNMRSLLMGSDQSILEVYKGEILFDKFNVYILERRGSDKGASVRYAKNMTDLNHTVNYEKLYNGVYPFYHQETTEATTESSSDGFKKTYIVGSKPFQDGWLSYEPDGEPYHPVDESPVQIMTEGDYYNKVYAWNVGTQRYTEKIYNEMVNIVDYVTGVIGISDKPSWIYIDVTALPNIVIKAAEAGYFKLATETDWTKRIKGEVIFQGSITNAAEGLLMYYSEVIPSEETVTETESTSVTHVELKDKILWLDSDAAKEMKYDRILCLDLTSEFEETPDQDKLEAKAKEYIEKNKIGQYKYDTKVSFIDLASTTEGTIYDKMETVELGDTVEVVYEGLNVDIKLRVISTTYNVLTNKYDNVELGEKPEKLSSSSVQTGDDVSSLHNDVGYTDVSTVNKLVAKIVTADLIQAKNAKLSKAQIEELQSARIKVTGLIEATQFELDTLIAKMLTADNAVIKQTLEAGTVKVKGDITVTKGAISIQSTESGTVFNVDRSGNVIANSVHITGGELNINNNFTVTPTGILSAIGAYIEGEIRAISGTIASFNIETDTIEGNTFNRIWSGDQGYSGYVLMSPGYKVVMPNLDNNDETKDTHKWAFLAGTNFGVDNDGNLYAKTANISGTITATSGNIGQFTITPYGLSASNIEITPEHIKYGPNEEFLLNSDGTLTIQNVDSDENVTSSIILTSEGLTAKAVYLEYAQIKYGNIGLFTISDNAIYSNIPTFNSDGNTNGVYIGPDGIRLGNNLRIYPDGRITSGSRIYNENNVYNKGDYAYYGTGLYRCLFDNTTGTWNSTKWEQITDASFGIDETGKLTALNAEIIGYIQAHEGYIGTPEEGFRISNRAIYNGFSSPTGQSLSTGVYIGTDGIRLGQNVSKTAEFTEFILYDKSGESQQVTINYLPYVNIGYLGLSVLDMKDASNEEVRNYITNDDPDTGISDEELQDICYLLGIPIIIRDSTDRSHAQDEILDYVPAIGFGTLTEAQLQSIYDICGMTYMEGNKELLNSEFIFSYDAVSYDRWIEIREKKVLDSTDDPSDDFIHDINPNFIPIAPRRAFPLPWDTVFDITSDSAVKIDGSGGVDKKDSSLYSWNNTTKEYDFIGGSFIINHPAIDATAYIKVTFYQTLTDLLIGANPISSKNVTLAVGPKGKSDLTIAMEESPYYSLKLIGAQPNQVFDLDCWEEIECDEYDEDSPTGYQTDALVFYEGNIYQCNFTVGPEPGPWPGAIPMGDVPEYDENVIYNRDSIVYKDSKALVYKCLEDNVTGTWDNTKWMRLVWKKKDISVWDGNISYGISDYVIYNGNVYQLHAVSPISNLSNCSITQERPALVKLPANSTSISIIFKKYANIKIKFDTHNSPTIVSGNYAVTNLKLTMKTLPGFLVTPDGMLQAYKAKIYGSFIGDLKITGGSIAIAASNSALKTFISGSTITNDQLMDISIILGVEYTNRSTAQTNINNVIPASGLGDLTGGQLQQVYDICGMTYTDAVFKVSENGDLYAQSAEIVGKITATSGAIGNLTINTDGTLSYSTVFKIDPAGNFDPDDETIGNFAIECKSIHPDSLYLGASTVSGLSNVNIESILNGENGKWHLRTYEVEQGHRRYKEYGYKLDDIIRFISLDVDSDKFPLGARASGSNQDNSKPLKLYIRKLDISGTMWTKVDDYIRYMTIDGATEILGATISWYFAGQIVPSMFTPPHSPNNVYVYWNNGDLYIKSSEMSDYVTAKQTIVIFAIYY